jgi:small subunit ribosomal protein S6
MIVFRADLQEVGVKEQIERIRKLLEGQGATVEAAHEWGLRELAYQIEKERRGYYVLVEYTAGAVALAELERQLKLAENVLRYVSVRQDESAPVVAPPVAVEEPGDASPDAESGEDAELAGTEAGEFES